MKKYFLLKNELKWKNGTIFNQQAANVLIVDIGIL